MCLMVFPSKNCAEKAVCFAKTKEVKAQGFCLAGQTGRSRVKRESSARDRRYTLLYKCHPELAGFLGLVSVYLIYLFCYSF